ncbi:MAG: holo-ACP synthase [Candidatus Margulisiibacteriota bacterium]
MLGVDIVEIERIQSAIENPKTGQTFLNKLFTPAEQDYCRRFKTPYERFAGRFAAKEAIAKLISQGPKDFWLDIEIVNDDNGAPQVRLSERLKAIFPHPIALSISHERHYAVAVAIKQPSG